MERYFLWGGIALSLFSLWAIARNDWLRLTRPSRRVLARVTGHRAHSDNDGTSYAAIYAFTTEAGDFSVEDQVLTSTRTPEIGATRELAYPEGRPDLARTPRPLTWLVVYAALFYLLGMLVAKLTGRLP